MKKMLLPMVLLVFLAGCSKTEYSPVINTEFCQYAVYKTGDFSYNCRVERRDDAIIVTPTDTYAKGMTVTCDGGNVVFCYDDMTQSFSVTDVNPRNPAYVLYQVFSNLQDRRVIKVADGFQYSGKTTAGDYTLVQDMDNSFLTLVIPDADISVSFKNP